jgi:hypothetical protein
VSALAATKYPSLFEPDPLLPAPLATAVPSIAAFWSAARGTLAIAGIAAVAALALRREFFRTAIGRALGVGALLLMILPSQISRPGEFAAAYLPDVAMLGWLAFCGLVLLGDHAAAWVFFGALALGGPAVVDLVSQGAAADRVAGWGAAALIVIAVVALVAGRREISRLPTPAVDLPPPPPAPAV